MLVPIKWKRRGVTAPETAKAANLRAAFPSIPNLLLVLYVRLIFGRRTSHRHKSRQKNHTGKRQRHGYIKHVEHLALSGL